MSGAEDAVAKSIDATLVRPTFPDVPLNDPSVGDAQNRAAHADPDQLPTTGPLGLLVRLQSSTYRGARYDRLGEIARGGMGVIYEIWDDELRRTLAMKVALPASSTDSTAVDPTRLARFLEEAQITGQLEHPGIVPVHEIGLSSDGLPYFTMHRVQGDDLRAVFERVRTGTDGWTRLRALDVLIRVCEALAFAHDKGVIHRDVKPANVMVGRFGQVYVMDWGVARLHGSGPKATAKTHAQLERTPLAAVATDRHDIRSKDDASEFVTMMGDIVGTPSYMSPEQARGELNALGPHSDVYAVGAMLYELVTGQAPFAPPGTSRSSLDVLVDVQQRAPTPAAALAPDTPPELLAIVEKAMARDVAARYPTAFGLAEDLRAYLEGRVVRAYETGAWAEARKWVRRNRALAAALLAAVLVLIAGLGAALFLRGEALDALALATTNEAKAISNERVAREQKELAMSRAEDVLRLSALQLVEELVTDADAAWPAHPDRIGEFREWIARAQALLDDLPRHRAKREELLARITAPEGGRLPGLDPTEETEARWWSAQLAQLIERLEALNAEKAGLLAPEGISLAHGWSVPRRLVSAEKLAASFGINGEHTHAWERDLPAIRAKYPNLEIGPQMGLVPIGADPRSGLWEFAHLMSGTPAERDAEGNLVIDEETGIVLVLLPAGSFAMGAQADDPAGPNYDPAARANETPVHDVALSAFFLSKYETTQAQWMRLTGANPSQYGPHRAWGPTWLGWTDSGTLMHPLEQVTWFQSKDTLARAGLVLPSEAQWEYGARGGTTTSWWSGADVTSLSGAANVADAYASRNGGEQWGTCDLSIDDGAATHAPIGHYAPNPFGLHDVAGNVQEWCLDAWDQDFYKKSPPVDPVAPYLRSPSCVNRGGGNVLPANLARSSARHRETPTSAVDTLGVRPARPVTR